MTTRYDFRRVADVDVFYREAGPVDAPAVLLLHGNVQPANAGTGPLLVFSLRVFRATAAPSELFGAAPRATAPPPSPQFDAAVNAALAETLPWRSRPAP